MHYSSDTVDLLVKKHLCYEVFYQKILRVKLLNKNNTIMVLCPSPQQKYMTSFHNFIFMSATAFKMF